MNKVPQLTSNQMVSIIRNGLQKSQVPKRIIVVGAGMAGLVSSALLKEAGHDVTILEASERVGGRVYTKRSPFYNGEYLEAGAMRIPEVHDLVLEYIKKFNLVVNPFINSTPNDLIFANGIKTRLHHYQRNPEILNYPVTSHEKGKTAAELFKLVVNPVIDFINQHPQENWDILVKDFDKYSLDTFLRYNPIGITLSPGAIEKIKVLLDLEGLPELSFLELLRAFRILLDPTMRFYEIAGGNDRLPQAFLPFLKENILFSQKVTKMIQHDHKVTIYSIHQKDSQPSKITGDLAIVTLPFSVLNFVDFEPYHSISHNKRKAIRELHYVAATKIGIQFSSRFWERQGLLGGKMVTDLPTRFTFYPSHGNSFKSGVVLASYTWEDDAMLWDSLNEKNRIEHALKNLASVHGSKVYNEFITGTSHSWAQFPFSGGGFSMFKPEQETELSPFISTPEGRIHFAGEHTSTTHAWIQGAVESGIRAAYGVNNLPRAST